MVKDLGSTSFGLLIAFILPGLALLFSFGYWIQPVDHLFAAFLTAESTIGLSILVILVSIGLGLYVSAARYLVFERVICRHTRLCDDFSALRSQDRLASFRAAVDEMYRFHQFWGGMTIVLPLPVAGWLQDGHHDSRSTWFCILSAAALFTLGSYAAIASFKNYVRRANLILGGQQNAERLESSQAVNAQGDRKEVRGEETVESSREKGGSQARRKEGHGQEDPRKEVRSEKDRHKARDPKKGRRQGDSAKEVATRPAVDEGGRRDTGD